MKLALKKISSKRVLVIVLVALFLLSAFNTYLILERTAPDSNPFKYDFVLSQDGDNYILKNMQTGAVAERTSSASTAINTAFSLGKSVYLNPGTYTLTSDIIIQNKVNPKIISDDATIIGNGYKILITGDDHTKSRYALISGLTIINASIRVEDSFATTIQNSLFKDSQLGIEFANTKTWSEYNKVENCQFYNITTGIVFRTPTGNATGSYASSKIVHSSFNVMDYSVGIIVERLAEFSDSQIQNVRFWLGEYGRANQTALLVDGSMYQTLLFGVVFESFTDEPVFMYAIDLAENCDPAPILDGGVSFLGDWTAKVHNPFSIWILGVGSIFSRQNIEVTVGTNDNYDQNTTIQVRPLKISSFKPRIEIGGNFASDEVVTVRIRIEYIDNTISKSSVRTFNTTGSTWLSDDEMLTMFSSQSIIWAVLVDAKSNVAQTNVKVQVSGYGTAA